MMSYIKIANWIPLNVIMKFICSKCNLKYGPDGHTCSGVYYTLSEMQELENGPRARVNERRISIINQAKAISSINIRRIVSKSWRSIYYKSNTDFLFRNFSNNLSLKIKTIDR